MTHTLKIGQVLVLRMRFNNSGAISNVRHPYLIVDINKELNYVEIAQIDSLEGKEYKAAFKSNKVIYSKNPPETVIDKDSFVQLDNLFRIEYCSELESYRRQEDTLTEERLEDVIKAYVNYHNTHEIDENKNVYLEKEELLDLNT